MCYRNKRYGRSVAGLVALVWWCGAALALAGWSAGDRLPGLGALGVEGKLPDLTGKVVLVDFWASWCGPCKKSFPVLEELHRKHAGQGLVVLGVNLDDTAAAMEKFLAARGTTFPMVRDASRRVVEAAGVTAMPSSFLVDRRGVIRHVHTGFHGDKTVAAYTSEIEVLLREEEVAK